MSRTFRVASNIVFCVQVLLLFLIFVEDKISLPAILQVAGRFHPLILHIPIGTLILVFIIVLLQHKLDVAYSHQVVGLGLLVTSFFASLAALFGFFLSLQGDYAGDTMEQHKISGVALSWLCYLLLMVHQLGWHKLTFFSIGGLSFVVLVMAGHSGAVLTHGENFLLEPIAGPPVMLTADNASAYDFAVAPIFEKKCYSCHNESKAKGKLVMTDVRSFTAGGEHGKAFVEGNPEESRLIKSINLPLEHDEHMPPDGKPQLTALEVKTIRAWIRSGASFTQKMDQYDKDDSLKLMVASLVVNGPSGPAEKSYAFSAADEILIRKVNTPFVSVTSIYQNSPALQAEFYVRKGFDLKSLEQLKQIQEQLVSLSLSRMPVENRDLSIVAAFKNLEVLNLNFTAISSDGVKQLESLTNLRVLSLSGTAIDAGSLTPVLKLPGLRELFVWATRVTPRQADSLKTSYPSVNIFLTAYHDESVMQLSKPMLVNDGIIPAAGEVVLKHPMNGVAIRYTLDGQTPDSVNGQLHEKPFSLTEATLVKSVGCKDGWYCSDPLEIICFVAGRKPDHVELLNKPDDKYPGEGGKSLTDGRKGLPDVLMEPSWLGYRKVPFVAQFSFDEQPAALNKLVLSYARNVGGYSLPPSSVEVWGGDSMERMTLITKMTPEQPQKYERTRIDMIAVPLNNTSYRYYKVVAHQLPKLPKWHNGKGERSWVFIDEVFFY